MLHNDFGDAATGVPPQAWRKHGADLHTLDRALSLGAGAALGAWALQRRGGAALALGVLSAVLLARGVTGRDPIARALRSGPAGQHIAEKMGWRSGAAISRSVTIDRPRDELYAVWRNFENLPQFMENIESVRTMDGNRSHWVVRGPAGTTVEWDSEIVDDEPGRRISWRSLEGADIRNIGEVQFEDAPDGRGTIVRADIAYEPPAGKLGRAVAMLFQREPALQAKRDLRRFKQLMEAGEIAAAAPAQRAPNDQPSPGL